METKDVRSTPIEDAGDSSDERFEMLYIVDDISHHPPPSDGGAQFDSGSPFFGGLAGSFTPLGQTISDSGSTLSDWPWSNSNDDSWMLFDPENMDVPLQGMDNNIFPDSHLDTTVLLALPEGANISGVGTPNIIHGSPGSIPAVPAGFALDPQLWTEPSAYRRAPLDPVEPDSLTRMVPPLGMLQQSSDLPVSLIVSAGSASWVTAVTGTPHVTGDGCVLQSPSHVATHNYWQGPSEGDEPKTPIGSRWNPCSREWQLQKKTRKRRKPVDAKKTMSDKEKKPKAQPRQKRRPFQDQELRTETALTRELRCCMKCRMLKSRCRSDPSNPAGPCLPCQKRLGQVPRELTCLRWIITDSSLYREQRKPYQMFSTRWQDMDLVDIKEWASPEVRKIRLCHVYLDGKAPYEVEVKRFVPVAGDMLEERWTSNGVVKVHPIPQYALSNMKEAAQVLLRFVDKSIGAYMTGTVGEMDSLVWHTYLFAFKHAKSAKTAEERALMANLFRFWVGCRKTSNPECIVGEDKLGGELVDDPNSVFHNTVPMPAIMIAQMECILYTKVLRPTHLRLLKQLNDLVQANKREYWLTIYLSMFILLHSCAMVSRRDWETARQYGLKEEYCNQESIAKHQMGANVLLAHFHDVNKGAKPFRLVNQESDILELRRAADMNDEQIQFVMSTIRLLREPQRVAQMSDVTSNRSLNHDLYWVAQLYQDDWVPGPTA